jgi:tRNA-splicing ligase RtcB
MAKPAALARVSEAVWELPVSFKPGMRVPARIYGTEKLIGEMDDAVYDQVTNVATLPGIVKYALCMPDGHFGYGFPIGGVAAMDVEHGGVISPGGIGFDINCGMRLVRTNLTYDEVRPRLRELIDKLFAAVPAGVGSTGFLKLSRKEFRKVAEEGSRWCVERGYGWNEDLELTEDNGCTPGADASTVSERAVDRGFNQIGTLGSGNHYLEIQVVRETNIFDRDLAQAFGLTEGQVVVMFHCGSRGFGHQVATDYLRLFLSVMESKYGIHILDRELACAPYDSPEGKDYFAAMKCALNMSFANRQMILHRIREVFSDVFGQPAERLAIHMVYDIAHNTA